MNSLAKYLARERLCRRHAELGKKNWQFVVRKAEIWAKLARVEERL
jgi:hypothetical protein